MPISRVVRRMRGQWAVVTSRSEAYAAGLSEWVSGATFIRDVLRDVDPRDCDEVLWLLHRRGIVWVSRQRGAIRVYGRKPETVPTIVKRDRESGVIAALAPILLDLVEALEDRQVADVDSLTAANERVAVLSDRAGGCCQALVAKGASLPRVRAAMWKLFPAAAMRAVAYRVPSLQRDSRSTAFPLVVVNKPKRLPNGLAIEEKLFRRIEKEGARGMSRTDLVKRVRPRMSFAELDALTGQLESAGLIVSGKMRLTVRGRPGTRLFAASIGLPFVNSRGVATIPS